MAGTVGGGIIKCKLQTGIKQNAHRATARLDPSPPSQPATMIGRTSYYYYYYHHLRRQS
jgi:hypothetical protein